MNAIGTQLNDPINSGLTQWRLGVYVDTIAKSGRNPVSKHQIQLVWKIIRLTWSGTIEPVSWDQILRHERGQGENYPRSADHEEYWQPYPIDPYSTESADHALFESSKHIS